MNKQDQTERKLEEIISLGRWRIMDKLPPERILAEELSVSRNTLRTAIKSLCGRGILETKRSSGTVVRTLPPSRQNSKSLFESMRLKTEAFKLIMPQVVLHCAYNMTPSTLLNLEFLLPQAGIAIRTYNIKDFTQIQIKFFIELTAILNNNSLSETAAHLLPEGRELVKLLETCRLTQSEMLFATLAKILGALRRGEHKDAATFTTEYATALLQLLDTAG